MSFVVFTSDKYLPVLKGFSSLFNKYWSPTQDINILGFKAPSFKLPPNFNFISAGRQEDYKPKDFCSPFRSILQDLPGSTITYFLEDTFLIAPVDMDRYEEASTLINSGSAQKIQLFWGGKEQYVETLPFNKTFREFPQNLNYRCNLAPSIIDKEYFLKYFIEGMSMWDFEISNMAKSKNDGAHILVSWKKPIVPWFNVVRQGEFNHLQWQNISKSDSNHFGWNRFQTISSEDFPEITQYQKWKAE
jgi:hypothetical protein